MNLKILLTGQSNAAFYSITDASKLAAIVASQLGFTPGSGNTVTAIGGSKIQGGAYDNLTTVPYIALMPPNALYPTAAGYLSGSPGNWGLTNYPSTTGGQQAVDYLRSLPAAVRASPTVIVWMHNESDSTFPNLSPNTWENAARYYAGQLRAVGLGQSAANTPIIFVNVPFHSDMPSLFPSSQAIRDGMQALIADPSFDAGQGPQTAYFDMGGAWGGPLDPTSAMDGGPHMTAEDKAALDQSLAPAIARQLQAYAQPGSAAALALDAPLQPEAWLAQAVGSQPNQLLVHVLGAQGGLVSLGAGIGWGVAPDSTSAPANAAISAQLLGNATDGDASLLLTFAAPVSAGATLYYGYADSRLSSTPTGAAEGNQIRDAAGQALLLPEAGLTVGQASTALPANVLAEDQTYAQAILATGPGGTLSADGQAVPAGVDVIQFLDGEYDRTGTQAALVARLYQGALDRPVDAASLSAALQGNYGPVSIAHSLLASQEYAITQGTPNSQQFITALYDTILGRAPTGNELQASQQVLQSGVSRADFLAGIAQSQEATAYQSAQGFGIFVADQAPNPSSIAFTASTSPAFSIMDTTTDVSGQSSGDAYSGPVNYLRSQFIESGNDSVNITANTPSVFLQSGAGTDALQASAGSNVLSGGAGSNFLVGSLGLDGGADTFFLDATDPFQTTWSTIVNWHPGDSMTLWGLTPAAAMTVQQNQGAAGYQGATLEFATQGPGTPANASVTFAGVTAAELDPRNGHISILQGTTGGLNYLCVHAT